MQTRETENIKYHLTERHIYGSARLGMDRTMVEMATTTIQAYPLEPTIPATEESERYLGRKYYELSNHLGNVLTVITDEKRMILDGNNYSHYASVVVSVTDYSPFGVSLTGRTFTTTEGYRYGFNGQEKESEITGQETHTSAEFWMYDARAGRRWEIDPVIKEFESPYVTLSNSPISLADFNGADTVDVVVNHIAIHTKAITYTDGGVIIPDRYHTSTSTSISIKQSDGQDVFRYIVINTVTDDCGTTTTTSIADINVRGNASTGYRTGGHNIKGFTDDREALGAMLPDWLLNYYADKNKGFDSPTQWGCETALAYNQTVPLYNSLKVATEVAYSFFGVYGLYRTTISSIATKGTTVLGKYPDYINLAKDLNARRFNIPSNIWSKMTETEQWAANAKFLERMIKRGDNIVLSNRVTNINNVTGAFRKELDYLIGKGYKLNFDGTRMIK